MGQSSAEKYQNGLNGLIILSLWTYQHWRQDMVKLMVISSSLITSSAAFGPVSKLFKVGDRMG
jgi:hypothetical protein